ncbi:MAG: amidohydrolase [Micromonosporaceae bacterium]|nr:amidohydrolase [Micromonosporaceae bacterium]
MIIDVHGHYTMAPPQLDAYRGRQLSSLNRPQRKPLAVNRDAVAQSLQEPLRQMDERGIDVVLMSPRAAGMGHDIGDGRLSRYWSEVNNDLIRLVADLAPGRFVPVCQLPQSPDTTPADWLDELRRCADMGFVGCLVNPDISGGLPPFTPPLGDRWWYPLWEAVLALDFTVMIHASATRNPSFHLNGSHYIAQHYAATVELCSSQIFNDFPTLRIVVPHGGGGIVFNLNRHRSLHRLDGLHDFDEALSRLYLDTAVYDQDSLAMMLAKLDRSRILYAAEMFGTAKAINPETGRSYDDNLPMLRAAAPEADLSDVLWRNALAAFPLLARHLPQGLTSGEDHDVG